jgi:hypothetical protein
VGDVMDEPLGCMGRWLQMTIMHMIAMADKVTKMVEKN